MSKNGEGRAEEVLELVTEVCVLHGIYTTFPQCNFEPEIPHKILYMLIYARIYLAVWELKSSIVGYSLTYPILLRVTQLPCM